jgi:hypothetical protein
MQAKPERWAFFWGPGLEPGETPQWDVTAMCLELGAGPDNEGLLAFTDRRLFFGWIDIKKGSLEGASGAMYRVGPDIHAHYRYKTASGVSGAVRAAM